MELVKCLSESDCVKVLYKLVLIVYDCLYVFGYADMYLVYQCLDNFIIEIRIGICSSEMHFFYSCQSLMDVLEFKTLYDEEYKQGHVG